MIESMPKDLIIETELKPFSETLIIDEIGGLPTLLVDNLLSRGFLTRYIGIEPKSFYLYLSDKNNFRYLSSCDVSNPNEIDYVFYFPAGNKLNIDYLKDIINRFNRRIVVCVSEEIIKETNYLEFFKSSGTNVNLIIYGNCFGPRIKLGILGNLFQKIKDNNLKDYYGENLIVKPVYGESLAKEIIKLAFFPVIKNKTILIKTEKKSLLEFLKEINQIAPLENYQIKETVKNISDLEENEKIKKVILDSNSNEEIEFTLNWFKNDNTNPVDEPELLPNDNLSGNRTEIESSFNSPPGDNILNENFSIKTEVFPAGSGFEPENNEAKNEAVVPNSSVAGSPNEKLDFLYDKPKKDNVFSSPKKQAGIIGKVFSFIIIFVLLLSSLFAAPLLISLGLTFFSFKNIDETNIKESVSDQSDKYSKSESYFSFAEKILVICGPFYSLIGLDNQVEKINQMLIFSRNYSGTKKYYLLSEIESSKLFKQFFQSDESVKEESLGPLRSNLSLAYEKASIAQTLIEGAQEGYSFLKQDILFNQGKDDLLSLRENIIKQQTILKNIPEFLAIGKRKVYLVLFQNNMELRPTGGFISAIGLLTIENGRLVNFETENVYDADKKLSGQIEPPEKIQELLGEKTWYLRDSNWDPDFVSSAQKAIWFIDKELQITPDGVIALNSNTIKELLKGTGKLDINAGSESVDENNVYEKIIKYSNTINTQNASDKSFYESLLSSLFEKIKTLNLEEIGKIQNTITASLEKKDILAFFIDRSLQSMVTELNYSGGLRNFMPKIEQVDVFPDYFYINEANVGINQVNYFVKRKVDHQIIINNQNKVSDKLTITLENQSPTDNWPFGKYKTYLRIYLPKEINITSILTTDSENPDLWIPYDAKQAEIGEDHGKTLVGLYSEVPGKTIKKIEIDYDFSQNLALTKRITSYLLMIQKQPGIGEFEYNLSVLFPSSLVPVRVIPNAEVRNGQLFISGLIDKDKIFQIDFVR